MSQPNSTPPPIKPTANLRPTSTTPGRPNRGKAPSIIPTTPTPDPNVTVTAVAGASVPVAVPVIAPVTAPVAAPVTPVTAPVVTPPKPQEPNFDRATLPQDYLDKTFSYRFIDPITTKGAQMMPIETQNRLKLTLVQKFTTKLTAIPTKVSLRPYVERVLNQGSIGACVAHSAVQAIHILMAKAKPKYYRLDPRRILGSSSSFWGSRLYIYNNARQLDGTPLNQDLGTTNLSACQALTDYKVCSEDLWPYTFENVKLKPPHQAYDTAFEYKTFRYSKVDTSPTDLKYALAEGYSVMIGVLVFPSFMHSV